MPTSQTIKAVAYTLVALALIYRMGAEDIITGRTKFLGIF